MNAADTSLVDRVEYYADDSLIGTTTEADLGGSYRFVWDLSGRTDVRLKVIMFDKLGNQIPQQVSVRHASAATPSTSPATTNPADQPTGFTAQVARAAAVVQKAAENIAKAVQRVILLTPRPSPLAFLISCLFSCSLLPSYLSTKPSARSARSSISIKSLSKTKC